ncbi:MAG: MBL fold metallo-hydrolase [Micrococcales bacterium]|nr:MBL fold metallo-hydrolase [Micrococcales bacterium]
MTLDGTNTWILRAGGSAECAVVDPGPLDETHLQAVAVHVERLGVRCARILLTHHHLDHIEGAERFAALVGAPISFPGRDTAPPAAPPAATTDRGDPQGALGIVPLGVEGLQIEGIPTPGHTLDSYCFHVPLLGALLTGDTILGRGTTVVAWPDGALGPYLASLRVLADLVSDRRVGVLLPGHGAPREDAGALIDAYVQHRHERLDQVRAALPELTSRGEPVAPSQEEMTDLVQRVVETVYADVPLEVWPAARRSVHAQLEYLREHDHRGVDGR